MGFVVENMLPPMILYKPTYDIIFCKLIKQGVEFSDVRFELQVSVQHDKFINRLRHHTMYRNRKEEKRVTVVSTRLSTKVPTIKSNLLYNSVISLDFLSKNSSEW